MFFFLLLLLLFYFSLLAVGFETYLLQRSDEDLDLINPLLDTNKVLLVLELM